MELYKSKFSSIEIDTEKQMIIQNWTSKTKKMTDKEFKKDMLALADTYERQKPKKVLVRQKHFKFIIVPKLQKWVVDNVAIKLEQSNTRKIAFVVSKETFVAVSVEQTIDEESTKRQEVKFFKTEKEAKEWLFS